MRVCFCATPDASSGLHSSEHPAGRSISMAPPRVRMGQRSSLDGAFGRGFTPVRGGRRSASGASMADRPSHSGHPCHFGGAECMTHLNLGDCTMNRIRPLHLAFALCLGVAAPLTFAATDMNGTGTGSGTMNGNTNDSINSNGIGTGTGTNGTGTGGSGNAGPGTGPGSTAPGTDTGTGTGGTGTGTDGTGTGTGGMGTGTGGTGTDGGSGGIGGSGGSGGGGGNGAGGSGGGAGGGGGS